jgi:hypothetical protein
VQQNSATPWLGMTEFGFLLRVNDGYAAWFSEQLV